MVVADIGAGEGYYTVRLAPVVGRQGRVLAEDIVPEVEERLIQRVHRENLENVAVKLGEPDDPKLPPSSFDRIFLVHVYHEVESPYAFMWHLRQGLKPDGRGHRGGCGPAAQAARDAAPPPAVRARRGRAEARPLRADCGRRSLFRVFPYCRSAPEPGRSSLQGQ